MLDRLVARDASVGQLDLHEVGAGRQGSEVEAHLTAAGGRRTQASAPDRVRTTTPEMGCAARRSRRSWNGFGKAFTWAARFSSTEVTQSQTWKPSWSNVLTSRESHTANTSKASMALTSPPVTSGRRTRVWFWVTSSQPAEPGSSPMTPKMSTGEFVEILRRTMASLPLKYMVLFSSYTGFSQMSACSASSSHTGASKSTPSGSCLSRT